MTEYPMQHKMIRIKTSVANYPVLNTVSPYTNEEVKLANKCRLNNWVRPPPEFDPNPDIVPYYPSPNKSPDKFSIGMKKLDIEHTEEEKKEEPVEEEKKEGEGEGEGEEEEEKKIPLEPKTRAAGGIWISDSDFPFSFKKLLVFHNPTKYKQFKIHNETWKNPEEPFIPNEKEILIRISEKKEEGEGD